MSTILAIPDALETELQAQAARLGIPIPQFALQLLENGLSAMGKPKSGAEMVDYWTKPGLIGFRDDILDTGPAIGIYGGRANPERLSTHDPFGHRHSH